MFFLLFRYMIENMQEENEQNLLHQETTNGFIDEKIKLLEEAFNLTVTKIDEHKVRCMGFSIGAKSYRLPYIGTFC